MRSPSHLARRGVVKSIAAARSLARTFRRDQRGVAAVEFALVLPIMTVMMIGAIEMSQAVSIDRRISQVAGSVGDLTARFDGGIQPQDLSEIVRIGGWLLRPFPTNVMRADVSLVTVECQPGDTCTGAVPLSYGGQRTRWRCTYNSATATVASCACESNTFTAPRAGLVDYTNSPALVVTRIDYDYTPLFFDYFMAGAAGRAQGTFAAYTLSETIYHKPRGATIVMNQNGATTNGAQTCNLS